MKFEVELDELEEMAQCIYVCSWVSAEELYDYMKSCITDGDYDPEDWSVDGRDLIAKTEKDSIIDGE